jgi:hypothetical protein
LDRAIENHSLSSNLYHNNNNNNNNNVSYHEEEEELSIEDKILLISNSNNYIIDNASPSLSSVTPDIEMNIPSYNNSPIPPPSYLSYYPITLLSNSQQLPYPF